MKKYALADTSFAKCTSDLTLYPEEDFSELVRRAKVTNNGFVVEYKYDSNNKVTKTILGWNVKIITYKMACEIFAGNLVYREIVEKLHTSGKNEVFAWVLGTKRIINMSGFNYSRFRV